MCRGCEPLRGGAEEVKGPRQLVFLTRSMLYSMMYKRAGELMAQMVRKQIYIEARQETLLKRLAKDLGITEAELIRQGLDQVLQAGIAMTPNLKAWKRERGFLTRWGKKGAVRGKRTWSRGELYDRTVSR